MRLRNWQNLGFSVCWKYLRLSILKFVQMVAPQRHSRKTHRATGDTGQAMEHGAVWVDKVQEKRQAKSFGRMECKGDTAAEVRVFFWYELI